MIVYDCEIINGIEKDPGKRIPGINYCRGWDDFSGMGISCICAYDFTGGGYRVFLEDNFSEFAALVDAGRLICGFNNHRFDDRLCRRHGIAIKEEQSYDLLAEIIKAIGGDGRDRHRGLSLNKIAGANLTNMEKTENGADAPVYWQHGRHGKVIDYCLNDVKITVNLIETVLEHGALYDPRPGHHGERINLQRTMDIL